MPHEPPSRGPPTWAYAYEIVPAQPADRLRTVKLMLDRERAEATHGDRTWEGRLIVEQQATHILIVSDTPAQNLEVNRRLETALKRLKVEFALTAPMAVGNDADPSDLRPLRLLPRSPDGPSGSGPSEI